MFLGPLDPGEYKFFGDFHQDTAQGVSGREMTRLICALAAALALLAPLRARADFHVISPYEIDLGELEIETQRLDLRSTIAPAVGGQQSYTLELGTGLTAWWHSEIEFGFNNDPSMGQPLLLTRWSRRTCSS